MTSHRTMFIYGRGVKGECPTGDRPLRWSFWKIGSVTSEDPTRVLSLRRFCSASFTVGRNIIMEVGNIGFQIRYYKDVLGSLYRVLFWNTFCVQYIFNINNQIESGEIICNPRGAFVVLLVFWVTYTLLWNDEGFLVCERQENEN
jgi:hypothetical protein